MNKGITPLILLVVLAAMGLVMFFHIGEKKPPGQPSSFIAAQGSESRQSGLASPLHAPQGETGSLRSIDLPISNAPPPQSEGLPQSLRFPSPFDGSPPQSAAVAQPSGTDAGGSPGTPPASTQTAAEAAVATEIPLPSPTEEARAPASGGAASAGRPAAGSPGLTPWESPPQEVPAPQVQSRPQETPAVQPQARPQAAPHPGTHALRDISLRFAGQGIVLQIEADSPFPCNAFVLSGPDRLVVDLPGSWTGMRIPPIPENRLVKNVRLGQQSAGPRLVLDLAGPIKEHKIERAGNTTRIILQ